MPETGALKRRDRRFSPPLTRLAMDRGSRPQLDSSNTQRRIPPEVPRTRADDATSEIGKGVRALCLLFQFVKRGKFRLTPFSPFSLFLGFGSATRQRKTECSHLLPVADQQDIAGQRGM